MNDLVIQLNRRQRWIRGARSRVSGAYRYDTARWRAAVVGMWAMGCVAVALCSLGMPTGLGMLFGIVTAISLHTIAMALAAMLVALLLALVGLPVPRFTMGSAIYIGVIAYWILDYADVDFPLTLALSVAFTIAGATCGCFVWAMADKRVGWRLKVGLLSVAASGVLGVYSWLVLPSAIPSGMAEDSLEALPLEDPSMPGNYAVRFLTYGSGRDLHRFGFGGEADLISAPADGSAYISKWPWPRKLFWGFDQKQLPLNGRVWMPEGEGPFPLVLMVHGNHLMEYFSEEGYDYLGELLASRGMIAVSLDENFLNYSVWSGIPKQDMKIRAWVILKHLQQIESFAEAADSPFYRQVDFNQVALLGHSRGGQAAAMAADRDRWFASDPDLPEPDSYTIQAVAALAPTDTTVDGKTVELDNIHYLTLQGAHDADVDQFYGARQYVRTTFPDNSERFKAALYIANANHSYFNTEWGGFDLSFPEGLFLNRKDLLHGEDQRQIAKAYVSAFLETVFHGKTEYVSLFRDYRVGASFLPDARYYSRFGTGDFAGIAQFDHENDRFELSDGVTEKLHGVTDQRDRNMGLMLEWEQAGSYKLVAEGGFVHEGAAADAVDEASLVFTMAQSTPDSEVEEVEDSPLKLSIELKDKEGESVRLPVDHFMPIQPVPETKYTWLPWMEENIKDGEDDKLEDAVFQTYEVPLSAFLEENPDFSLLSWNQLTFRFSGGPRKAILDDIGIAG